MGKLQLTKVKEPIHPSYVLEHRGQLVLQAVVLFCEYCEVVRGKGAWERWTPVFLVMKLTSDQEINAIGGVPLFEHRKFQIQI